MRIQFIYPNNINSYLILSQRAKNDKKNISKNNIGGDIYFSMEKLHGNPIQAKFLLFKRKSYIILEERR